MPVVSYRNNFADNNNPNAVILTAEEKQKKFNLAFPRSADSFGVGTRSVHTMLFTVNQSTGLRPAWLDGTIGDFFNRLTPPSDEKDDGRPRAKPGVLDPKNRVDDRATRISNNLGAFSFYIPNPMIYTNSIEYSETNLTDRVLNGASMMSQGLGTWLGAGAEASKLLGLPLNPKVEVIFNNIFQRTFQYEFLFAPTSEQEAQDLKEIIKFIRMHAAPERGYKNIVWNAPNTFDIQFLHNGKENEQVIKIDECVCEQVDVDYSPGGAWQTFRNGFPVQVRMQLKFREREPNDRGIIEKGF